MKAKVNDKLYVISLIILIFWFVFDINTFISSYNKNKEYMRNDYEICISSNNDEDCKGYKEALDNYKLPSTPALYNYIISLSSSSIYYLSITAVLFVSIPCIFKFYSDVRYKFFKFELSRKSYSSFMFEHYKESLKSILILPLFLIITFLITCFITNFDFNQSANSFFTSKDYISVRWKEYFITMIIVVLFHSQFYINLAYITFYKAKHFVVNILLTYLCYIFSQVVVVFSLQFFLSRVLMIDNSSLIFSLEDPLIMRFGMDVPKFEYMIITSLFYAMFSFVLVYLLYRKKERFVMANE